MFGERLCTSVGYAIAPDKWDDKTQRVKNSRLNLIHGHFERLEAIEKKLTKDEVMKVLRFQIPENGTEVTLHDINGNEYKRIVSERKSLEIVRDLLCFCCFTSLRYSDMDALKCTDIVGGKIYVTTMKTDDSLVIEVNKFAAEILDKYKDCELSANSSVSPESVEFGHLSKDGSALKSRD